MYDKKVKQKIKRVTLDIWPVRTPPLYRLFKYTVFPASFKTKKDKTCPTLAR
jgi:hypothetical protein